MYCDIRVEEIVSEPRQLPNLLVFFDLAVADVDDTVRVERDVVFVSDENDRIALLMEALEQGDPVAIVLDVHLSDRSDGWALAELAELLGPRRPYIVFATGAPQDIPPEIAEIGATQG